MDEPDGSGGGEGLQVGVVAPTREELIFGSGDPGRVVDFCRAAESAGLDSVWVGESLLARPRFEPLTLLAAVATATSRITVGTAVLLPALRHPVPLAQAVATLDRLAGGRLVLGVGAGAPVAGTEAELAAVGVAMSDRVGRVVEGLDPDRLAAALYVNIAIDDHPDRARREQRAHLGAYYGTDPEVVTAFQANHAGTPASAAEYVQGFVDAGARHIVVRPTSRQPAGQLAAVAELAARLRRPTRGTST